MGSERHRGEPIPWGKPITVGNASSYGIVRLPLWTGPAHLPANGADRPLPGVPSDRTARDLTKADFVDCVYPGCGPYSHVAGTEKRRAGFVHHSGKSTRDHVGGDESLDHLNSKAALLSWVLSAYGDEVIDHDLDSRNIKSKIAIDSGGIDQVRPDAWIKFKNGQQVAIEYQYSVGDPKRVIEKTRAYRNSNIAVWWIFSGRSPKTCINVKPARHVSRYGSLLADLSAPQKALTDKAIPFFWFDYESARLATPIVYAQVSFKRQAGELWGREVLRTQRQYVRSPRRFLNSWVRIFEHSLEECAVDLDTGILVTPGTRAVTRDAPRVAADIEALRAQARERFKDAVQRRNRREATSEVQLAQKSSEVQQPVGEASIESVGGDVPMAGASSSEAEAGASVALGSSPAETEGARMSPAVSGESTTNGAASRQVWGWGIWRMLKGWFSW